MKKTIGTITFFILMTIYVFTGNTYATDSVGDVTPRALTVDMNVEVDKTTVNPGDNVTVSVKFGKMMGKYTVKVAYDNNIFEYASAVGGAITDTGDKVDVAFTDATGGTSPRDSVNVTFKAKESITTSNPTEVTVTAENLQNADGSETYDSITVPIVKNITVEPVYADYTIKLDRPQTIIKGKETEMTITYSSAMGRFYEHARLVAEATTPQGGTVKILGTDNANLEHDIIQSGWGDAQGFKIGGKDVAQSLKVRGIFSEVGSYTVTLNLIDRDNSDRAIASSTFLINVTEENNEVQPPVGAINNNNNNDAQTNAITNNTSSAKPTKLPKTGINIYVPVSIIIIALMGIYIYHNKKENYK